MVEKAVRRTHEDLMEFLGLDIDTMIEGIDVNFDNIGETWVILVEQGER